MKNEDIELIHQILSGDENAFVSLVQKYQKQVHALAWRKIGDFHIAEEITQDTFLKVYQKLETLKNPKQFSGWLYVIANRQCLAWLRKKRIETESLDDTETEFIDETAYSKYVAEEQAKVNVETQREVVKKLLAKLKESERTVMTLHYLGEMTIEEISRFLGVSASAIKLRLHRARQRLQKEEPMIREAISNFQLSPNITENIMQKVERIRPATPSSGSKPFIPWVIGASSIALIVLMLGMGSQYFAHFQRPYSLDAQSEMVVELINVPIVQNLKTIPDNLNQIAAESDESGKRDGSGEEANTDLDNDGDYTQWNLPENAKARLGKGSINGISVSPDNTQIAVASATGVWIYDAHTGAERTLLNDHITPTAKVTFSPDGKLLATGSGDRIIIWNTDTGTLIKSFKRKFAVIDTLKITDDNKTLICEGYGIQLWDISTGEKREFIPKSSEGFNAELAHILGQMVTAEDLHINKNTNTSILAVGNEKGEIRLEDASTGQLIKKLRGRTGRDDDVYQLAFSPDGNLLVSNTYEKPLHLWDVRSGKLIKTLTQDPKLTGILEFSNDGKTLVCQTSSEKVELWDVDTQTRRIVLDEIEALAFSPDSKTVAGANHKGEIKVWDTITGDEMSSFNTKHIQRLNLLEYSSDTNTLVSGHTKTIRVWDTYNYTQLSTRLNTDINTDIHPAAFVFSPKDRTVTTAARFGYFKIKGLKTPYEENLSSKLSVWKMDNEDELRQLPVESRRREGQDPGKRYGYSSSGANGVVAFSKNGYMLAAVLNEDRASEHYRFTIHLWAIPFEKSHAILKGHTAKINAISLTPDGKTLASGSSDGTIRIWDTSTGNQLLSLPSDKTRILAISVDGKILASSNASYKNNHIKLWDISTGTQLNTLKGESNYSVTELAISPDNSMLTSGYHDGKIRLWDITTGNQLNVFKGHFDMVNALSFSSDGKTLVSGSYDGAIFLWNLTSTTKTNQDKQ